MRRGRLLPLVAFLFAGALFTVRLGDMPLIQPDEGRNAEVAREMSESGDRLVPTYDGLPYLDKPAFYFALVSLSYGLFGVDEAAARLPSAALALCALVALFIFCRRRYGEPAASLSVLTAASIPLFLVFARTVIFDMPLTFFVTLAILAGFQGEEAAADPAARRGAGRWWFLLGAAASGVATLIKGPVGFLVPALVVLIGGAAGLPGGQRRSGFFRRFFSPPALLVFFGITLPWFFALAHRRPDFVRYGLVEETFRRYSTTAFHRTAPVYYYLPVVLGTFFPWSLLLPEGFAAAWRRRRRLSRADRILLLWPLVVVLFFTTSRSKLPGYVLSAAVPTGALIARLFTAAGRNPQGEAGRIVRRGLVALGCIAAVLAAVAAVNAFSPGRLQTLLHIRSEEFDRLQPVFGPASVSLLVVALAAAAARMSRSPWPAYGAFLLFPLSLLTVCYPALYHYAEAGSARALAAAIRLPAAKGTVACVECFPTGLPFYLRRPVHLITKDGHELTSNYVTYELRTTGDWPPVLIPGERRDSWLEQAQRPLCLLSNRRSRLEALDAAGTIPNGESAALTEPVPGWWQLRMPGPENP